MRSARWKVTTSAERIEAAIAQTIGRQIVKPSALGKSIYSHLYKVFSTAQALSPSRWSSNVCYFVKADKCFSGEGVGGCQPSPTLENILPRPCLYSSQCVLIKTAFKLYTIRVIIFDLTELKQRNSVLDFISLSYSTNILTLLFKFLNRLQYSFFYRQVLISPHKPHFL